MILGFMDISVPIGVLFFPIVFSFMLYWILKILIPQAPDTNELLDFEGNTTITNYRTHAFWISIFFILIFIFFALGLFFLAGAIAGLAGGTFLFLIPFLILGYGFYNVIMMIKYREPRDYKYWIGYVVISFFSSLVFFWLATFLVY